MKNMKKNIVLSTKKAIGFGAAIAILISTILSLGAYDVIAAFYGEMIPVGRGAFFIAMFPGMLIIMTSVIVGYTLISLEYKDKK